MLGRPTTAALALRLGRQQISHAMSHLVRGHQPGISIEDLALSARRLSTIARQALPIRRNALWRGVSPEAEVFVQSSYRDLRDSALPTSSKMYLRYFLEKCLQDSSYMGVYADVWLEVHLHEFSRNLPGARLRSYPLSRLETSIRRYGAAPTDPSFFAEARQQTLQNHYPELADRVYELTVVSHSEGEECSDQQNHALIYCHDVILPQIELGLSLREDQPLHLINPSVQLAHTDNKKVVLTLRFPSFRWLEAALRIRYPTRLKRVRYFNGECSPKFIKKHYRQGTPLIVLAHNDLVFADIIDKTALVDPVFFAWHEWYHLVDHLMASEEQHTAVDSLEEIFAGLPKLLKEKICFLFLEKDFTDREHLAFWNSGEFLAMVLFPAHCFFVDPTLYEQRHNPIRLVQGITRAFGKRLEFFRQKNWSSWLQVSEDPRLYHASKEALIEYLALLTTLQEAISKSKDQRQLEPASNFLNRFKSTLKIVLA